MKRLLSILLLAAALAASPAAGQTVKSLGYNTTNGQIVYSGSNSLTFTNALQFSTNARAATRTNLGGTTVGNAVFTATNAAAARSAIGAGTVNEGGEPSFESVTANLFTAESINEASGGLQALDLLNFSLTFGTNYVLEWSATDVQLNKPLTFFGTNTASTTRTNLGLGATNNVTFSNITASGTLAVTGNVTMSGVNNTAPSQTASSGSSLMTRDLVGQEFAILRNRIQATYYFALQGLGGWTFSGSGRTFFQGNGEGAFRGQLILEPNTKIGSTTHLSSLSMTENVISLVADFDLRATIRAYAYSGSWPNARRAVSFQVSDTTTFWGNTNTVGIFVVPQPTNVWTASASVAASTAIAVSNVVWAVSTAGTNGATEPAWTDLIGSFVTNGSAVYVNRGPHTSNNYVLARGNTNASGVTMTNMGMVANTTVGGSGFFTSGLLRLQYVRSTQTYSATIQNSLGSPAPVSLAVSGSPNVTPRFHTRSDFGSEAQDAGLSISTFSINAAMPDL